jgi:hypothetical protein
MIPITASVKKLIMTAAFAIVLGAGGLALHLAIRQERFPLHRLPKMAWFDVFRRQRTLSDIRAAHNALEAFYSHYGRLPFNRPNHELQFPLNLGHDLNGVGPGQGRQNTEGIVFWNLPAGDQRDGWQRCYNFYFDHDNDGIVHPVGKQVHRKIVIWSNGPNRLDEGGEGDDLRDW